MKDALRKTLLICLLLLAVPAFAAAEPALPMDGKSVLAYLDSMIDWRHRAVSVETPYSLPQEQLFRNALQIHAAKTLRAGFDVARALAVIIDKSAKDAEPKPATEPPSPNAPQRGIGQATARVQQRIQQLQAELGRTKSRADRANIDGQIRLAHEHLALLKTVAATLGTADGDSSQTLAIKIQQLAGTMPDIDAEQVKSAGPEAVMTPQAAGTAPPSGLAGLGGRIYGLMQERSSLRALQAETQILRDENIKRTQAVRAAVQDILRQGDELRGGKSAAAGAGPAYDALLLQMKEYSAVAVALSRLNMTLRTCAVDLSDWSDLITQRIHELVRVIAWRVGMLLFLVLSILGLSTLASRATKRYVLDERRRVQFRTVRRGILSVTVGLIVFLAFFTDFGSLATFAGLLTAGIAVSLQKVLLSIIAYFNFFGPFGIRLGDRVTVAGVTGKVIQITPLRFNLMELRDSDFGYLPSGRVVGFSNSILFQPTPFFRQTGNTNFVWSEINLTLDPTVDYEETYKKLSAVVARVYARHSDVIKRQEAAFENLTKFKTEVSVPQTYLKITGTGIVMVIRYAVQREYEKELQLEMTKELLSAIKKDPALKFVNIS